MQYITMGAKQKHKRWGNRKKMTGGTEDEAKSAAETQHKQGKL